MIKKKIYTGLIAAALIFAQLPLCTVTANATQSMAARYLRTYLLTGNKAVDITAVALAQKGKTKANLGYSEAWCADFISDCAYLSGASDVIPANGSVSGLYKAVLAANGTQVFTPQAGDLVFYYCTQNKTWVHCGIMISSTQSIEGNYSSKVSLVSGIFKDIHGHTLASGDVTRTFIRPAYSKSKTAAPKTISNNPAVGTVVIPDTSNNSAGTDDTDNSKTTTDTLKSTTTETTKSTTKTTTKKSTTTTLKFYKKYAGTYKINTTEKPLIMRKTASKTVSIITSIPKGTKVKVTKASGTKKTDWAYVTYKSFKGYMSMEFLKKVK